MLAQPELWVPALIETVNQDLGPAGSTVEELLSHFAAARPDFQNRFWLYQEIPAKSAHFLRLQAELASWIIERLDATHQATRTLWAQMNLNLSEHLRDGGRVREAPPYSRAAIDHYEAQVNLEPSITGDLVWAWMLHAQQLAEADRSKEAVEANLSAVRVAQRLEGQQRNRLLGQAYVALGAVLLTIRQQNAALDPLRKAHRLLKQCQGPEREYEAIAAPAAVYLADALLDVGREMEAQPFADEAHRGFGLLVAMDPGVHLKDYLWATNVASRVAIACGQLQRSRALRYEGVQMLMGLADRNPRAFLDSLLQHLVGLISALINEQQLDEAERHVRQAIRMARKWGRLTRSTPASHLGNSYTQLANICLERDRIHDGLRAAIRARFYLRQLPKDNIDRIELLPTVDDLVAVFRRFK